MNSPFLPLQGLDPVAMADISAAQLSVVTMIQESVAASVDESVQLLAAAPDFGVADERALDASTLAENPAWPSAEENPPCACLPVPAKAAKAASVTTAAPDVLTFYGLPQQPFDVTPDPAFLYFTGSHRGALASLKEGIEHFRGFMTLVAEPGMGKTTLLNQLMEDLADSARVIFLFQTQCTSRELLSYILNELEVDHAGMDIVAMHRALNQALLEEMLRGRRFVLIVDEAQNLQGPVLETIRLLSDFETTHSKLIQIVLAGQPQLAETLMAPSLVQMRQRIAVLANLKALSPEETSAYVEHRLRAAGSSGRVLFATGALDAIAELSGGVPRSINSLCFSALLEGFHRGLETIEADIVKEVAGRLNLESLVRRPETAAVSAEAAAPAEPITAADLARVLASAFAAQAQTKASTEMPAIPEPTPNAVLTGTLTEKVRSQGWSKHHEYRILVTLERDPISGLAVADRYYCASLYMDEAQAATLEVGKPVRIKIEQ